MTKAQIELLIQVAITVRNIAPPDEQMAIKDCLISLANETEKANAAAYSAWTQYRPGNLINDELAEYVIQSKGIVII